MNQQERREYMRAYYRANREQILANKKLRNQRAPEKANQYARTYRSNHRDKYNKYQSDYYHAHKEEINARRRERRAAKKAATEAAAQ